MPDSHQIADSGRHNILTGLSYLGVAILLALGWWYSDLDLISAETGIGYWLGIVGASLMALLLLYPLRKRAKSFQRLGPVRYWFRTHMVFGVVGPVLIIFHSNYDLGSLNSRIALFCTIIVASSGIVGRYIYAKLHYGLYGRRASLISLRKDIRDLRGTGVGISKLIPDINEELNHWEDKHLAAQPSILGSFFHALTIEFVSRWKYLKLKHEAFTLINSAANDSDVLDAHKKRLFRNTKSYLNNRVTLVRKFAQYRHFERLFSLWHIVHYPLFLLLVIAAIVHVVAVHMY